MYILRPDEKTTPVMLYTHDTLVRGEAVTKQSVLRLNIWLRTDGAPKYIHLLNAQVLVLGGGATKALSYSELYFPTSRVIGFHTLPPAEEPLDYDPEEANRVMEYVEMLVGTFVMRERSASQLRRKLVSVLNLRASTGCPSMKPRLQIRICHKCRPCMCRWFW